MTSPQRKRAGEQQDFFISQLKQEIYELRQRQRDQAQLEDQKVYLDKKYRQLEDEKRLSEREFDQRIQSNLVSIEQMIKELDQLKDQNLLQEQEQEQLLETIRHTSADQAEKQQIYEALKADLSTAEYRNFNEKKEIDRLEGELRDQKGLSHKNYQDIGRLKDISHSRDLDNKNFGSRIQGMELEILQNNKRIQHLNEVREQKELDIASVNQRFAKEQQNANSLKYQINQLDQEIQYFENQNHKHEQAQTQLSKGNEYEYFRGKDLEILEQDLKVKLKAREDEVNQIRYENEHVKSMNAKYIGDSQELQLEIEALNKHMSIVNQQNYELSQELEKFIETDEQVRRSLNRKNKVEDIRHKVDEAILKSMAEVQSRRSPERMQRESPAKQYRK